MPFTLVWPHHSAPAHPFQMCHASRLHSTRRARSVAASGRVAAAQGTPLVGAPALNGLGTATAMRRQCAFEELDSDAAAAVNRGLQGRINAIKAREGRLPLQTIYTYVHVITSEAPTPAPTPVMPGLSAA